MEKPPVADNPGLKWLNPCLRNSSMVFMFSSRSALNRASLARASACSLTSAIIPSLPAACCACSCQESQREVGGWGRDCCGRRLKPGVCCCTWGEPGVEKPGDGMPLTAGGGEAGACSWRTASVACGGGGAAAGGGGRGGGLEVPG